MQSKILLRWVFRFTVMSFGFMVIAFIVAGAPVKWIIVFSQKEPREEFIQKHTSAEEKPNLRAETLTIESTSTPQLFHVDEKLIVTCGISGASTGRSYKVVLKTDKEEIMRKTIGKAENDQDALLITGTYTPKESGLHPVACRVDFENEIEESDERDNRLVKYAMIF